MSKSSKLKKVKRAKKQNTPHLPEPQHEADPIAKPLYWWSKFLDKTWKVALIIIAILGGIVSVIGIKNEWFKSDKEKADEQTIYKGKLKPPLLITSDRSSSTDKEEQKTLFFDSFPYYTKHPDKTVPQVIGINMKDATSQPYIAVKFGGNTIEIPTRYFDSGINLLDPTKYPIADFFCNGGSLILGIKENRLYVSTEFKAIQNEHTMGIIEFNHWKVYKENALEYPLQNDTMFEVRDKQNKIAFAIKYGQIQLPDGNRNGVMVNGYFINDSCIIISNRSKTLLSIPKTDNEWKQKAYPPISQIQSIF